MLNPYPDVLADIEAVRAMGIRLSLGDFGADARTAAALPARTHA